jgi:hypothetical protein
MGQAYDSPNLTCIEWSPKKRHEVSALVRLANEHCHTGSYLALCADHRLPVGVYKYIYFARSQTASGILDYDLIRRW